MSVWVNHELAGGERAASVTAFNPSQLSGYKLDLDMSEEMLKADFSAASSVGDIVAYVPDKSGQLHGPSVTGSPVVALTGKGKKALQFNGNSLLTTGAFIGSTDFTAGITMFVVAEHNVGSVASTQVLAGFNSPLVGFQVDAPRLTNAALTGLTGFAPSLDRGTLNGVYMMGTDNSANATFGINDAISCSGTGYCTSSDLTTRRTIGGAVSWAADPGSALKIGGLAAGSFLWNGLVGQVIVYNRLLTEVETAQVRGYLATKWGYDKELLVCIGGSLTSGQGSTGGAAQSQISGTTNYANRLKALLGGESALSVRTDALPGRQIKQILANASGSRLYRVLYNPYTTKQQTAVVIIGGNDIGTLNIGSGVKDYLRELCEDLQSVGYRVIVSTIPVQGTTPDNGYAAFRANVNLWLRTHYHDFADKLADLDTRPKLADPLDLTYYDADKIHLNDVGGQDLAEYLYSVY